MTPKPKVVWLVYELVLEMTDCDSFYHTTTLAVFDSKERAIAWVEANVKIDGSWHPHVLEYRSHRVDRSSLCSWVSWCVEEIDFYPGDAP